MLMPPVSRYMSAQPHTVPRATTLRQAHRLMREHDIRHLPIVEDGELVGVVSERDLHLCETIPDVDLDDTFLDEAMTEHPFVVTGDTALDEVVDIMAEKKYGSAIIMGRDGVEGVFTSVDACRVLAELLRRDSAVA